MSPSRAMDVEEPLEDLEAGERDPLHRQEPSQPVPTRSLYAMTRQEITRGIANRFVHSRTYIFLYLAMAALSITTVVLSLLEDCPGLSFYILELVINTTMIAEVSIRFLAFGKQFWKSPFNVVDLILTAFCVITVLIVVFAGCGKTSKEEELFDTLLLVARNVLQFTRLATVMRQSGQSIFTRPRNIDLSKVGQTGLSLDFDLPDDYEEERADLRPQNAVVFDSQDEIRAEETPTRPKPKPLNFSTERDDDDVWASLG